MLLRGPRDVVIRVGHQGMISEIDTSSVVDETESTKVTTEVWAPYRKSDIDKLEEVLKRATKMIQGMGNCQYQRD